MARRKKEKKKAEQRKYDPHRNELGSFGTVLLMIMGAVMLVFFLVNMTVFVFGVKTKGVPYTRLVDGEVVVQNGIDISSTLYYTFTDEEGVVHEGDTNLLGKSGEIGSTVTIYYLPQLPNKSLISMSDGMDISTIGCLILGVILLGTGEDRLRKLRKKKREKAEAEAAGIPYEDPDKKADALAPEHGSKSFEAAFSIEDETPAEDAVQAPDAAEPNDAPQTQAPDGGGNGDRA